MLNKELLGQFCGSSFYRSFDSYKNVFFKQFATALSGNPSQVCDALPPAKAAATRTVDELVARQLCYMHNRAFEFRRVSELEHLALEREGFSATEEQFAHAPEYFSLKEAAFERAKSEQWVYEDSSGEESGGDSDDWEYFDSEHASSEPAFLQVDAGVEVINERSKLLVWATGSMGAPRPHQLAFKTMERVRFKRMMDLGRARADSGQK